MVKESNPIPFSMPGVQIPFVTLTPPSIYGRGGGIRNLSGWIKTTSARPLHYPSIYCVIPTCSFYHNFFFSSTPKTSRPNTVHFTRLFYQLYRSIMKRTTPLRKVMIFSREIKWITIMKKFVFPSYPIIIHFTNNLYLKFSPTHKIRTQPLHRDGLRIPSNVYRC